MNYANISKDTIGHLYKCHASLQKSELDARLRVLVELRTSQINGCAFCCGLHAEEARRLGIEQVKLDKLPGWRLSSVFDAREQLALGWTEAVTRMQGEETALLPRMKETFSEREVVDLTVAVSLMNALNRIAISLGDQH